MRKVELKLEKVKTYETIKKLVETNGNKKRAAVKLGVTTRQINRMIIGYKTVGKTFFQHGNKGRKPKNTLPDEVKSDIIDFYFAKYHDANFTHFAELLQEHEGISVSTSTVRELLMSKDILSPKARRKTKRHLKEILKKKQEETSSKKEADRIQEKIVAIDEAHPRRPRCANFGEMIQMDASNHHWFGVDKAHLHIAIDDATGNVVGAYFDKQETLKGYYNVFEQILRNQGIPYMFYTDRRTVFEYKKIKSPSIEKDTFTQFGYACHQLGVELKTTSIAQAKGRVERLFQTLQSRLPIELRLAGATTLEQANIFLDSYIQKYNAKFALPINHNKSVFERQPSEEKINLTLAVLTPRKIDNGHCLRFDKNYYRPINHNGHFVNYYKGTKAMIIKALDGCLFTCIDEQVYALKQVPAHEAKSRYFDIKTTVKPIQKTYIPALNHPWKLSVFKSFISKQKHYEQSFMDAAYSQALSEAI